jgi:hypothetical protein
MQPGSREASETQHWLLISIENEPFLRRCSAYSACGLTASRSAFSRKRATITSSVVDLSLHSPKLIRPTVSTGETTWAPKRANRPYSEHTGSNNPCCTVVCHPQAPVNWKSTCQNCWAFSLPEKVPQKARTYTRANARAPFRYHLEGRHASSTLPIHTLVAPWHRHRFSVSTARLPSSSKHLPHKIQAVQRGNHLFQPPDLGC